VGVGAVVLLGLGILDSYLTLAGFIAVVGVGTPLLLPDPRPTPEHAIAAASGRLLPSSLKARDFLWLLSSRLVVNIGNALGTALLLFFLLYGLNRPAAGAEDDLLVLIVIYTVFVVAASIVTGVISDRT